MQHLFQQITVKAETQLLDFRDEAECYQTRAYKVDDEDIADLITVFIPAHQCRMALFQARCNQENK